ncbi:MAG: hypothetical protein JWM09_234 [Francisellaceae bacterium]|nr:hypothetical protein [Francisellaceae bacterium]
MNRNNELDEHKDYESDMASDAFQQAQNDQIKGLANMMAELKAEFALLQAENIEIKQENKNLKKNQEEMEKNKITAEALAEQLQAQAKQLEQLKKQQQGENARLEAAHKSALEAQRYEAKKLKSNLQPLLEAQVIYEQNKRLEEERLQESFEHASKLKLLGII